jgi:hypothetical protein
LTIQPDGAVARGDYLYLAKAGTLYNYDTSVAAKPVIQSRRSVPSGTAWLATSKGWLYLLAHLTLETYGPPHIAAVHAGLRTAGYQVREEWPGAA